MTVLDSLQFLVQWLGLGRVLPRWQLANSSLQIAEHFSHAGLMGAMEGRQLVQDVVAAMDVWMPEDLPAGHHLKGDAAEAQAYLDARLAWAPPASGTTV
jgi:hypothetical protein